VQPGLQRADRDGRVQEGGDGDADGVETAGGDEVLPIAVDVRHVELLLELGAGAVLHAGDRDELDALDGVVGLHVLLAGPAEADDSDAEGGG
jgi:hypothetical protein